MNRFVLRVLCWLLVLCYLSEDECEERGGGGGGRLVEIRPILVWWWM